MNLLVFYGCETWSFSLMVRTRTEDVLEEGARKLSGPWTEKETGKNNCVSSNVIMCTFL